MGGDDDDPCDEDEEGNGDGHRNADDVIEDHICRHSFQTRWSLTNHDHTGRF
jgi:hypothetical protein